MPIQKIKIPLRLDNGSSIYLNLDKEMVDGIRSIFNLYNLLPEYVSSKLYRDNMVRVTLSDIDIENSLQTSTIESLSAICCKKVKNKNQKTALNLLEMLRTNVLNETKILSHEYIKKIWRDLTVGNRNMLAFVSDYRKSSVVLRRVGKSVLNSRVVYTAPNYKKIPELMGDLITFSNNEKVHEDVFINSFLKVVIFSAYFVYTHPFLDGNGRVSRLLMNKLLIDMGFSKFRYISVNSELAKVKSEYGRKLEEFEANNDGDITDYVRFMIKVFNSLMVRIANPNRKVIDYGSLSLRERQMLQIIKSSNAGIYSKVYKQLWNQIAVENNYKKINIAEAEKDIINLFNLEFLVFDERYTAYPGFKYYNK